MLVAVAAVEDSFFIIVGEVFDVVVIKKDEQRKREGESSQRRCVLAFSFSFTRTTRSRFFVWKVIG